jgi:hypothetical protein
MLETTLRDTWMTCETIALFDIGGEFMKSLVKEEFSIFAHLKMSWDMNLLTCVKILCNKCVLSSMYICEGCTLSPQFIICDTSFQINEMKTDFQQLC